MGRREREKGGGRNFGRKTETERSKGRDGKRWAEGKKESKIGTETEIKRRKYLEGRRRERQRET